MPECSLCGQLKERETSFCKYGAPEQDAPLPLAAGSLVVLPVLGGETGERRHVRRCPECACLYRYALSHEYLMNGTEDEEELVRMTPAEAAAFRLTQIRLLETLRREIDDLLGLAGGLGDYLDRGRPDPGEAATAFDDMNRYRRDASRLGETLREQVERMRRDGPEILVQWADVHIRVCRSLLASLPDRDEDSRTARYVAGETLAAWERLPETGETFISINTHWLASYAEHVDRALKP